MAKKNHTLLWIFVGILALVAVYMLWQSFKSPSVDLTHECTPAEKANQICTADYRPVCGSDGRTYSNGCGACAAKVASYDPGACSR